MGDLAPLMDSMKQLGLVHPILTRADYLVIDGARRIQAARKLGWTHIPVVATEDWHLIMTSLKNAREEAPFGTWLPMRWLEIDSLDRYILQDLYRPVRNVLSVTNRQSGQSRKSRASKQANQRTDDDGRQTPLWASAYSNDVCGALGITDSTLRCCKEIGAGIMRAKKLNPGLHATVLEIVETRETIGQPHSALTAIRAAIRMFQFGETQIPNGNPKKAREQADVIDKMASILESLTPGIKSLGEAVDPSMSADEARRLAARVRAATRRLHRLRTLLDAQVERQDLRQEQYAAGPEQDPVNEEIEPPKENHE